ncbi:MAG: bacteriohopanetetrol glucosamine biosynthesis glycosyltransferase HpnI [Alphaproteobacteria bacterium]|nr:bacteriohopanetetrol glucosamine biosynthesis glycosyltransferase HpnI [Alphaproteobacteria bacterium]MBN9557292.1 bacteriohopanetetrol glucosamine biosynthesis glycosyltransferase HpnI [Alphaproteobacteria bacterium]MBN9579668.1 bacteriohopanetetrol glucosamine biosynthesis glycosyltransferase HpnI [Alphaproteobacteria bacterium]
MAWLVILGWAFLVLAVAGTLYTLLSALLAGPALRGGPVPPVRPVPVTVLKPLHGAEPGLVENLETVLAQDYAAPVQVLFGVQDEGDPAIPLIRDLIARHPGKDLQLVVESGLHGTNRKVSNLINMAAHARHDILVLSDSDIAVPKDWLSRVAAALSVPGVGGVTCFYSGMALTSVWSKLSAMGISYQFLPNAIAGFRFGLARPCFGSTIAFTRQTLERIGGFAAFASFLADDYELGRAIRGLGLEMVLPPFTVGHLCTEASATTLLRHELRWNRTIRSIDFAGHLGSGLTHIVALALIAAILLGFSPISLGVLVVSIVARFVLKAHMDRLVSAPAGPYWLLPLRDAVSFLVYLCSFFGRSVDWRGEQFVVQPSGALSQS